MIKIEHIIHREEKRIAIYFSYNNELKKKIRTIEGCRWSATKRVWHVPDNKDSIESLRKIFPEYFHKENKQESDENKYDSIYVFVSEGYIVLMMKRNTKDIDFVKSLNNANWDANNLRWIISNNEDNRTKLKQYFGDRINIIRELPKRDIADIQENNLYVFEHVKGRIKLIFKYNKDLLALVRTFPYSMWDDKNRWWTTVYTREVIRELKQFCEKHNWNIEFIKKEQQERKKRASRDSVPNYKKCPKEYIDSLVIRRYSENTIRTYTSMFEEFINYYYSKKPVDISEKEIIAYIRYLVVERRISSSYQNQAINAIKYYYEQVIGESRKFYFIERPRREKVLPEVLSKTEVEMMIQLTNNLKHKCLLMITYSGGLRLGEVKNLKIKDIDFERNIINIRMSKGKKDRITLLSKKVLLYLHDYLTVYQPRVWLFEGIKGGTYGASSMEKVVKTAAAKARILKKVTMHTLRHSFATHLIEKGTDIRYIQSLLGHESIKTTEIYTHITNKGLDSIVNPLDDMEF